MDDPDDAYSTSYTRHTVMVAVAKLAQSVGFQGANSQPLQVLADLMERYIHLVGRKSQEYAEHARHNAPSHLDIFAALKDMGTQPHSLRNLLDFTADTIPILDVPEIPKAKNKILGLNDSREIDMDTPTFVYPWMPSVSEAKKKDAEMKHQREQEAKRENEKELSDDDFQMENPPSAPGGARGADHHYPTVESDAEVVNSYPPTPATPAIPVPGALPHKQLPTPKSMALSPPPAQAIVSTPVKPDKPAQKPEIDDQINSMFSPDSTASSPPQKSSQNSTLESIKQSVPVVLPVSPPPVKPLGSTSSFLPQPKSPPLSTSTPPVLGLKQKQKEPVPNPGSISSSSSEDPLNVVKPVKPANSSWERPVRESPPGWPDSDPPGISSDSSESESEMPTPKAVVAAVEPVAAMSSLPRPTSPKSAPIDPFDAEQKRRRKKERKEEKRREKEEKKAVKKAKKRERKEEEKKRKKHKKKNKSKNQDRDSDSDGSNSSIQPAQNQLTMKISLKNQQLGPDGRPRRPRGRPKKPERPKSPPKLRGRPPKDPKILAEKKAELMRAHADKEKKKLSENPDAKIQPVEPIKVKKTEVKKQEPEKVQTDKLIGDLGIVMSESSSDSSDSDMETPVKPPPTKSTFTPKPAPIPVPKVAPPKPIPPISIPKPVTKPVVTPKPPKEPKPEKVEKVTMKIPKIETPKLEKLEKKRKRENSPDLFDEPIKTIRIKPPKPDIKQEIIEPPKKKVKEKDKERKSVKEKKIEQPIKKPMFTPDIKPSVHKIIEKTKEKKEEKKKLKIKEPAKPAAKKPEVTPVKVKPIKEPKREEKKSKEKAAPPPIPKPVQSVQSVTVSTEKENTPYFVTNSDGYQEVQYFSEPWTCPTCKKEDDGSPMIGCDKCPDWYHNICVGITTVPEGSWFCPKCSKDKVKKKSKSKKKV